MIENSPIFERFTELTGVRVQLCTALRDFADLSSAEQLKIENGKRYGSLDKETRTLRLYVGMNTSRRQLQEERMMAKVLRYSIAEYGLDGLFLENKKERVKRVFDSLVEVKNYFCLDDILQEAAKDPSALKGHVERNAMYAEQLAEALSNLFDFTLSSDIVNNVRDSVKESLQKKTLQRMNEGDEALLIRRLYDVLSQKGHEKKAGHVKGGISEWFGFGIRPYAMMRVGYPGHIFNVRTEDLYNAYKESGLSQEQFAKDMVRSVRNPLAVMESWWTDSKTRSFLYTVVLDLQGNEGKHLCLNIVNPAQYADTMTKIPNAKIQGKKFWASTRQLVINFNDNKFKFLRPYGKKEEHDWELLRELDKKIESEVSGVIGSPSHPRTLKLDANIRQNYRNTKLYNENYSAYDKMLQDKDEFHRKIEQSDAIISQREPKKKALSTAEKMKMKFAALSLSDKEKKLLSDNGYETYGNIVRNDGLKPLQQLFTIGTLDLFEGILEEQGLTMYPRKRSVSAEEFAAMPVKKQQKREYDDFIVSMQYMPKDILSDDRIPIPVGLDHMPFDGRLSLLTFIKAASRIRQWDGMPVFLSSEEVSALGLSLKSTADPVHVLSDGKPISYYNLEDTNMKEFLPERYQKEENYKENDCQIAEGYPMQVLSILMDARNSIKSPIKSPYSGYKEMRTAYDEAVGYYSKHLPEEIRKEYDFSIGPNIKDMKNSVNNSVNVYQRLIEKASVAYVNTYADMSRDRGDERPIPYWGEISEESRRTDTGIMRDVIDEMIFIYGMDKLLSGEVSREQILATIKTNSYERLKADGPKEAVWPSYEDLEKPENKSAYEFVHARDNEFEIQANSLIAAIKDISQEFEMHVGTEMSKGEDSEAYKLASETAMFLADNLNKVGIKTVLVSQEEARETLENERDRIDLLMNNNSNASSVLYAPNGAISHLSSEEWNYVRTNEFKDSFGDWEKVSRIQKVKNSDSISIHGNEIPYSENIKEFRLNALKYAQGLRGDYLNEDTGRTIRLFSGRRGGVKEVLEHDYKDLAHLQSVAAIPQIIKNAIYIDSRPNEDPSKNSSIIAYDYFVCGLKIAGEDYTVKAVVGRDIHGDRYYDHRLTSIEKGKLIDELALSKTLSETGLSSVGGQDGSVASNPFPKGEERRMPSLSDIKDKRLLSILQIESKLHLDENLEPTHETIKICKKIDSLYDRLEQIELQLEEEPTNQGVYKEKEYIEKEIAQLRFNLENINEFSYSDGTIYGYQFGDTIYLTPDGINPNTPIHEYAHIWAKAYQRLSPAEWETLKDELRSSPMWGEVAASPEYEHIVIDEDRLAGEVLAHIVGNRGEDLLVSAAEGVSTKEEVVERFREKISSFAMEEVFGLKTFAEYDRVTLKVLNDFASGRNPENGIEFSISNSSLNRSRSDEDRPRRQRSERTKDTSNLYQRDAVEFSQMTSAPKSVRVYAPNRLDSHAMEGAKQICEEAIRRINLASTIEDVIAIREEMETRGLLVNGHHFTIDRDNGMFVYSESAEKGGRDFKVSYSAKENESHDHAEKVALQQIKGGLSLVLQALSADCDRELNKAREDDRKRNARIDSILGMPTFLTIIVAMLYIVGYTLLTATTGGLFPVLDYSIRRVRNSRRHARRPFNISHRRTPIEQFDKVRGSLQKSLQKNISKNVTITDRRKEQEAKEQVESTRQSAADREVQSEQKDKRSERETSTEIVRNSDGTPYVKTADEGATVERPHVTGVPTEEQLLAREAREAEEERKLEEVERNVPGNIIQSNLATCVTPEAFKEEMDRLKKAYENGISVYDKDMNAVLKEDDFSMSRSDYIVRSVQNIQKQYNDIMSQIEAEYKGLKSYEGILGEESTFRSTYKDAVNRIGPCLGSAEQLQQMQSELRNVQAAVEVMATKAQLTIDARDNNAIEMGSFLNGKRPTESDYIEMANQQMKTAMEKVASASSIDCLAQRVGGEIIAGPSQILLQGDMISKGYGLPVYLTADDVAKYHLKASGNGVLTYFADPSNGNSIKGVRLYNIEETDFQYKNPEVYGRLVNEIQGLKDEVRERDNETKAKMNTYKTPIRNLSSKVMEKMTAAMLTWCEDPSAADFEGREAETYMAETASRITTTDTYFNAGAKVAEKLLSARAAKMSMAADPRKGVDFSNREERICTIVNEEEKAAEVTVEKQEEAAEQSAAAEATK